MLILVRHCTQCNKLVVLLIICCGRPGFRGAVGSFFVVVFSLFPAMRSGSVLGGSTWLAQHTPSAHKCVSASGIKHDMTGRNVHFSLASLSVCSASDPRRLNPPSHYIIDLA